MRKFKTSQTKRETYKYLHHDEDGNIVESELTSAEHGITSEWIALLHHLDDEEIDAQRRHTDNLPTHIPMPNKDGSYISDSKNPIWSDMSTNPERILFDDDNIAGKYEKHLPALRAAMNELQPQQQELYNRFFVCGQTLTEIAKADNVSKTAVINRLAKLKARLKKLLETAGG